MGEPVYWTFTLVLLFWSFLVILGMPHLVRVYFWVFLMCLGLRWVPFGGFCCLEFVLGFTLGIYLLCICVFCVGII